MCKTCGGGYEEAQIREYFGKLWRPSTQYKKIIKIKMKNASFTFVLRKSLLISEKLLFYGKSLI